MAKGKKLKNYSKTRNKSFNISKQKVLKTEDRLMINKLIPWAIVVPTGPI